MTGNGTDITNAVPPHSVDAEMAVLGSMLLSRDAVDTATELLRPTDFYLDRHRTLFRALSELRDEGIVGDEVVAQEELKKRGALASVGGMAYLGDVISRTPSFANAENYCRIVKDKARVRKFQETLIRVLEASGADGVDVDELFEDAERAVFRLSEDASKGTQDGLGQFLAVALSELEALHDGGASQFRTASGFPDLDNLLLGGFARGTFNVVAGRPSMGKTTLALNIALKVATGRADRRRVLIFSCETAAPQLATNCLVIHGGFDASLLHRGTLGKEEWERVSKTAAELDSVSIDIDDTPALRLGELRARIRRAASRDDLALVVVDYLQLVRAPDEKARDNRQQEVAAISRGLKAIARETNLPLLVVSQLNREVEHRTDKRPVISDLRESGEIEQDADTVMLLFRADYYEKDSLETPGDEGMEGLVSLNVAKHRNGPTGKIFFHFDRTQSRFTGIHGQLTAAQRKRL